MVFGIYFFIGASYGWFNSSKLEDVADRSMKDFSMHRSVIYGLIYLLVLFFWAPIWFITVYDRIFKRKKLEK